MNENEYARAIRRNAEAMTAAKAGRDPIELDAFLAADEPEYQWLIPGLLERGDRLILTAPEGHGKSTLLRQLAVQTASGIHPFGGPPYQPLRVLLLDLENSQRQVRRELRPLRLAAGQRYAGGLFVEVGRQLNLAEREDADWLLDVVKRRDPDLLITGPAYKMVAGPPTEEGPASIVAGYFDRIRQDHGSAIVLEAHTPHANGGGRRPERPYGASLWLRWPEFGLHLGAADQLHHWRGQRDERDWPAALHRGGDWPFTASTTTAEVGQIIADLDRLGVASTAGRDTARKALTTIGVKVGNDVLAEALRLRKDAVRLSARQSLVFEQIPLVPDSPEESP